LVNILSIALRKQFTIDGDMFYLFIGSLFTISSAIAKSISASIC